MTTDQRKLFENPLVKARELKARRDFEAALQVLTQALAAQPEDRKLKASLADLHYRMDHPRRALALAGQILSEDPHDPRALVVMGNVLLARDALDEALEHFRLAIAVAPTDYLWGRVAHCHLTRKQPKEALTALNEAERLSPLSPRLLGMRAACFRMLGEREAERQVLLQVSRAAPADHQEFFQYVWPILSDPAPREAAEVSALLRQAPGQAGNPHLLLFEAESLLKSRDRAEARERLAQLSASALPDRIAAAADRLERQIGPIGDPES